MKYENHTKKSHFTTFTSYFRNQIRTEEILFSRENSNGSLMMIFCHCYFFLLWVLLLSIIRRICLMHTRTCNEKNLAWYSATHFKCNCCCCAVKLCVFLDKTRLKNVFKIRKFWKSSDVWGHSRPSYKFAKDRFFYNKVKLLSNLLSSIGNCDSVIDLISLLSCRQLWSVYNEPLLWQVLHWEWTLLFWARFVSTLCWSQSTSGKVFTNAIMLNQECSITQLN